MKRSSLFAAASCAAAIAASVSAAASDSPMVARLARTTGLAPSDVVMALGDRLAYAECHYYAHPSSRGHLARMTEHAYRRMVAARRPVDANASARLASAAPARAR